MYKRNYYSGTGILANKIADCMASRQEKITVLQGYTLFLTETGIRVNDNLYDFSDYLDRDLDTGTETLLLDWVAMDILYDISTEINNEIKRIA